MKKNIGGKLIVITVFVGIVIGGLLLNTVEEPIQITCKENGGSWEKVGKLQKADCIYYYEDEGIACTSSNDCQGDCIVTKTDGGNPHCADSSNRFGCKASIEDFKENGGIRCID